jgi:hypothetical protein
VALLLAVAFALTGLVAARTTPFAPSVSCCDHLFYRSMAYNLVTVTRPDLNAWPPGLDLKRLYQDPYHGRYLKVENHFNRQPPYAYRVVSPLVARAIAYPLGDNINHAFYALSFTALALASFFTALSVFELSGDVLAALASLGCFTLVFRLTRYHLTNYMLADPLAFLCLALGSWLMLRRNDRWFFALAFIAVFNKETHFFLLACYALMQLHERRLNRASLASYAVITLAYLAFRVALPIPNNTYALRTLYLGWPGPRTVVHVALGVFGALTWFACSRVWRTRFVLYLTPLAVGAFATALFAVDAERAYVYAFPLVFLGVFGARVAGTLPRLLAISPGLVFIAIELARPRLSEITARDWHLLELMLWVVLDGAFLLLVTEPGSRLRHSISASAAALAGR